MGRADLAELYDRDFYTWTQRQAEALRRAGAERVNTSEPIDWDNLAEEVGDMGKSQARELYSRLAVLVLHLLKWRYQPDQRSSSWGGTIVEQRQQLRHLLEESPGLKPQRQKRFLDAYEDARELAAVETGLALTTFPADPPFSVEQALDADFWPE